MWLTDVFLDNRGARWHTKKMHQAVAAKQNNQNYSLVIVDYYKQYCQK